MTIQDVNPGHQIPDEVRADAETALEILLDAQLEPIVDMVLLSRDGAYEARSHDGSVTFRRTEDGFTVDAVEGHDPLARQETDAFAPIEAEVAHKHPHRRHNSYPYAFESIAQLFDSPAAPDLCVLHSAAHNWEDQGGHRGEHGSLGVVQARAPWIIAGKGVRNLGIAPLSARLVDVTPTMAALAGCAPLDDEGRYLARQDGTARLDVLDPTAGRPRHVVGFLFDGTNANVLYDMALRGEAPNVKRLIDMGTAFGHGAMAALPTITLANHTSVITGAYPGHHGILNNAWYDRRIGAQVVTNSPATWPWAMNSLEPGIDSIHHAIHRTFGADAFCASINEPCDTGADFSTFGFFRAGDVPPIPEHPDGLPHTTDDQE